MISKRTFLHRITFTVLVILLFTLTLTLPVIDRQTHAAETPYPPTIESTDLNLTAEEKKWINEHSRILVGSDPVWAPIEFQDNNGEFKGIAIDYLKKIEERTGLNFEILQNYTWNELIENAKEKKVDVFSCISKTQERSEYLQFTSHFLELPIAIFTRKDVTYIGDLKILNGKKVAMVAGYSIQEYIKKDYPEIEIVAVKSIKEGLSLVEDGIVSAFTDNLLTTSSYIAKLGFTNLKVAGETPYSNRLAIGVRSDWPVLKGVLEKALDSITQEERTNIYNKWVSITYEHKFGYTLLIQIIAVVLTISFSIVFFFFYWNRKLSKAVESRTMELSNTNRQLRAEVDERRRAEGEVRENARKYHAFISKSLEGIYRYSLEVPMPVDLPVDDQIEWILSKAVLSECNDSYAKMYNFSFSEEITGKKLTDLWDDIRAGWMKKIFRDWINSGREYDQYESFEITGDGQEKWFLNSGFGLIENNCLIEIWGTKLDITSRKMAEDALRTIATRFSAITGFHFFKKVSQHLVETLKVDYAFIGELFMETGEIKVIAGTGKGESFKPFSYKLKGTPCENVTRGEVCSYPRGIQKKFPHDALLSEMGIEGYVGVPLFNSTDKPLGVIALLSCNPIEHRSVAESFLHIFSERVSSEIERMQLENDRKRLIAAIEQTNDYILITNPFGKIEYVNPAFERITGYSSTDAVGKNPRILKSGKHDNIFYRNLWETIKSGKHWTGRLTNKCKDGSLIEEDALIFPAFNPAGDIINFVAVKRDITEQVKMEERLMQTQKMEAIGTLAGGIAHDFNNILSGLLGYVQIAQRRLPENSKASPYLDEVYKAGIRAGELVKQILTFSRKASHDLKPLKLQYVVKEALKLLRASIPVSVKFIERINNNCDSVMSDPTQIHQIIMNLCTNAYHSMRESGGTIEVTLDQLSVGPGAPEEKRDMKPGNYVLISVRDTGCGMDDATIERAFEPYFSTKEKGEGTGLGLSVVHGIVQTHGGEIKVKSEVGKGSVFDIYLPVAEIAPAENTETGDGTFKTGNENILIVDDEEPITIFMKEMLGSLGYIVTAFNDSEEAIKFFEKNHERIDLVITDTTMPKYNGLQLSMELLIIKPELPVIICTGFSDLLDEKSLESAGIRKLIMKPVLKQTLSDAVREVLDQES